MSGERIYDLIGIGLGVFNLSLAAQLDENGYRDMLFLEKQAEVLWHGGMLLDTSELQVHYLKDLVTPVDPCSKYSFLNYLRERKLLYQFMNRKSGTISRNQFQYYFRWVAQQLSCVRFDSPVGAITYDGELFTVQVRGERFRSRHIALASGIDPHVPSCARDALGEQVFHVAHYAGRRAGLQGKSVAVIGGGQSGAEVVMDLLDNAPDTDLRWLSRGLWFAQLEDNCFINELYVPSFTSTFRRVGAEQKSEFVERLSASSDGINQDLLDRIYRKVFERRFFSESSSTYQFVAGQELIALERSNGACQLTMKSRVDGAESRFDADAVVLATGFQPSARRMLRGILDSHDELRVGEHFELQWAGQRDNHIFVQNGSRMCIGLADANLSIAAWRSAMIVNRLLGQTRYDVNPDSPMVGHLLGKIVA